MTMRAFPLGAGFLFGVFAAALCGRAAEFGDAALARSRHSDCVPSALSSAAPRSAVGDTLTYAFFPDAVYTVTVTRVQTVYGGAQLVEGRCDGVPSRFTAVIARDGERHDLHDFSRGKLYQAARCAGAAVEIREYDDRRRPPVTDRSQEPLKLVPDALAEPGTLPVTLDATVETIDLMIGFDAAAKTWAEDNAGGMTALAVSAVAKFNTALENSGIAARVRLIHLFTMIGTCTNSLSEVLTSLRAGSDAFISVPYFRYATGADLVSVFVDTGSAYGMVGVGNVPSSTAGQSTAAYSVCAVRAVNNSQTLAHEIGHNLGAGHSKSQSDSPGPSPLASSAAGWYFTGTDELNYHTVMAYDDDGSQRYFPCDYFSSPLVTWQGAAVGDAADGDNVTIMNVLKSRVAAYAPSVSTVAVTFDPKGGTLASSNATYTVGEPYGTLPTPVKDGYVFFGWHSDYGLVTADMIASPLHTTLTATWSGQSANEYTYSVSGNQSTLIAYNRTASDVSVPAALGGAPVTAVAGGAFSGNSSIVRVTLPDTVTSLGANAFNGAANLTQVHLSTGLVSIGSDAFHGCGSLTNLVFPAGVKSVPLRACYNCSSLRDVSLPEGLTDIDLHAFLGCSSLTRADLPSTVTNIGHHAFRGCASLTNAALPAGVTRISESAFDGCASLRSASLPAGLTTIESFAFYGCSNLVGIILPAGLTSIGDSAFMQCERITALMVPAATTNIGYGAFSNCSRLPAIQVDDANPSYRSVEGVLFDKPGTAVIAYPAGKAGTFTIPDGVRAVGGCAFLSCTGLTSITFPSGVTNIGESAFQYCTGLTSLVLPASAARLDRIAFKCCFKLARLLCKGDAPALGDYVFENSNRATVFYLPKRSGWGATLGGRPTAPWMPRAVSDDGWGVAGGAFGFNIDGTTGFPVVVEACTNLTEGAWVPVLQTNAVDAAALIRFCEPMGPDKPTRFYRLRCP
ncbi:MAG TPA: leucine-rich repeat protein [Kiritimatiellia bacterium]|nr:leucine-rich repeat protein [Kiritimatiellia bacterium]HPS08649.1 leucine-rich repeat protein [Kiritimatiellia bacterium]